MHDQCKIMTRNLQKDIRLSGVQIIIQPCIHKFRLKAACKKYCWSFNFCWKEFDARLRSFKWHYAVMEKKCSIDKTMAKCYIIIQLHFTNFLLAIILRNINTKFHSIINYAAMSESFINKSTRCRQSRQKWVWFPTCPYNCGRVTVLMINIAGKIIVIAIKH